MRIVMITAASGLLLVGACIESRTAERNAVYGAGAGAAAGALASGVFAGSPGTGAAIGAGVGALGGAAVGCARAGDCFGRARDHGDRRYDQYAQQYYYVDPEYGDTYWEDGEFRAYAPEGR